MTRRQPRPPRAARQRSSSPRWRRAFATTASEAAGAGCWSSRSTPSCSATGGRRGCSGSSRWSSGRRPPGCGWSPRREALAEHEPERRPLARLDLGRGQGPAHLGLAAGRRPRLGGPAARAAVAEGSGDRPERRGRAARRARAARGSGERLGVPRRARAGRRLRLPAGHRPRGIRRYEAIDSAAEHRPAYALARPGPESRPAPGALIPAAR